MITRKEGSVRWFLPVVILLLTVGVVIAAPLFTRPQTQWNSFDSHHDYTTFVNDSHVAAMNTCGVMDFNTGAGIAETATQYGAVYARCYQFPVQNDILVTNITIYTTNISSVGQVNVAIFNITNGTSSNYTLMMNITANGTVNGSMVINGNLSNNFTSAYLKAGNNYVFCMAQNHTSTNNVYIETPRFTNLENWVFTIPVTNGQVNVSTIINAATARNTTFAPAVGLPCAKIGNY